MEEMCAQWSGQGYVGNPNNCSSWGYCQGQKLVSWGDCGEGLTYNAQLAECVYSNQTVCKSNPVATCQKATSPMYVADPDNCNQYYNCDGKGNSEVFSCGTGAVFSTNGPACVWGPTCPQDSICQYMKNDIFVGDPKNCGQYILCSKGLGTSGTCDPGNYYNLQTGNCESKNTCDSSNSGSTTDDQFTVGELSAKDTCPNGWKDAEDFSKTDSTKTYRFVSDGATCYGYYYCETENAVGVWNSCPTGTHFNPPTGQCVSPATYACPYNRCGNVAATFMATVNSGCETYTYCAKGTPAECPAGNPYFDEVNNICTSSTLSYEVCTATVTIPTA
ncbi:hypothetical protein KR074_002286 [Drosophila pseudoananassae]|nr:hypothetical protein KR074_002286 [Drosophila pseudoananassae]